MCDLRATSGYGGRSPTGDGVADLRPGDRVAYTGNGPVGSYCEARVLPRSRLQRLPDGISDETAAAIMLKDSTSAPSSSRRARISSTLAR